MRPMSNDELTKHAIRTSADMLELNEKIDDIRGVQDLHTGRLDRVEERLDRVEERLDRVEERLGRVEERLGRVEERLGRVEDRLEAHIAVSEDHFRRADANFIEIRDLLGKLIARGE